MKLKELITTITESFGGPGKMILPANHKAGLKVPKGGSCCANCKYWDTENEVCTSKYYQKWAKTDKIPYAPNEYCTNWWEPNIIKVKPKTENE